MKKIVYCFKYCVARQISTSYRLFPAEVGQKAGPYRRRSVR